MKANKWIWPIIIFVSTLLVGIVVFSKQPLPIRIPIAAWFLLVIPGMAYVRQLKIKDQLSEWTIAIALSLALDALVSLIMVYIKEWSPEAGLRALMLISLVGALIQAWTSFREWRVVAAGGRSENSLSSMVDFFILPSGVGFGARALRLLLLSLGVLTFFSGLTLLAALAVRVFTR